MYELREMCKSLQNGYKKGRRHGVCSVRRMYTGMQLGGHPLEEPLFKIAS